MRLRLGAALASAILACGSFESGDAPPGGTADGGPGTSSGGGADGGVNRGPDGSSGGSDGGSEGADGGDAGPRSPSGCAVFSTSFILCSDFDASTNAAQATLPAGQTWAIEQLGSGQITVAAGDAFSPDHFLAATGVGSAEFLARVHIPDVSIQKDIIRLQMKVRVRTLPTSNDVNIAGLTFSNITFALVLHANGKIGLTQKANPGSLQPFTPTDAVAITPNEWKSVELFVNRGPGATAVGPRVEGTGSTTTLATVPINNAELTIGLGNCVVDCGKPDVDYDNVVLTEE